MRSSRVIEYPTLLSLNRLEGKKNHGLAIETFATVRRMLATEDKSRWDRPLRLIIGGKLVVSFVSAEHITHLGLLVCRGVRSTTCR